MFSVRQKRMISDQVQEILRNTGHPELPSGEISFHLHVDGAHALSWADIKNNGAVLVPGVNPHNEKSDDNDAPRCVECGVEILRYVDGSQLCDSCLCSSVGI